MRKITLGKTGITVNKNGFGALPIQRISESVAFCGMQFVFSNLPVTFETTVVRFGLC